MSSLYLTSRRLYSSSTINRKHSLRFPTWSGCVHLFCGKWLYFCRLQWLNWHQPVQKLRKMCSILMSFCWTDDSFSRTWWWFHTVLRSSIGSSTWTRIWFHLFSTCLLNFWGGRQFCFLKTLAFRSFYRFFCWLSYLMIIYFLFSLNLHSMSIRIRT